MSTRLGRDARAVLRDAGVSEAEFTGRFWPGKARWVGSPCGCPDDRCAGYHHEADDPCGCLRSLITSPA